ncbi:MAG: CPBP family intramembrane metalloprotease [Balneolales bacterium]|nr:CPBP family intramembrane metalloprotease [Balneolales bacterium]
MPLFALYEILIIISQPGEEALVRLTADIWIRTLLLLVHENTLYVSLVLLVFLGAFIFYREKDRRIEYKPAFFGMMIAESTVWAIFLAFIVSGIVGFMFSASAFTVSPAYLLAPAETGVTRLQMLALSIGAGLYEELIFRVVLVFALIWVFNLLFDQTFATALAIVLAAIIFSAVHYTGSLGDAFTWPSFIFRMLFGLLLNGLLVLRGFGITAWTHSVYDILLVMFFWYS